MNARRHRTKCRQEPRTSQNIFRVDRDVSGSRLSAERGRERVILSTCEDNHRNHSQAIILNSHWRASSNAHSSIRHTVTNRFIALSSDSPSFPFRLLRVLSRCVPSAALRARTSREGRRASIEQQQQAQMRDDLKRFLPLQAVSYYSTLLRSSTIRSSSIKSTFPRLVRVAISVGEKRELPNHPFPQVC